jgi:plasmid stabilization system protein ParE
VKVRFLSAASEEFLAALEFYFKQSPQAASDFEAELEQAVRDISSHPTGNRLYRAGIRGKQLDKFPYTIFYHELADAVEIISVAHNARFPGFWAGRES